MFSILKKLIRFFNNFFSLLVIVNRRIRKCPGDECTRRESGSLREEDEEEEEGEYNEKSRYILGRAPRVEMR